jgi:hypothetical protein
MSCVIYKLAHGANFLVCSELFAIGKLIISLVLHEFVKAINITFTKLISWPIGTKLNDAMESFKQWCGLPNVHGAMDGNHIIIYEPQTLFPKDYYYHKIGNYSIVVQAIINCNKKFTDLCVGMLDNVNDYRVLHRSTLYQHVQFHGLSDPNKGVDGVPPYLLSDKGYPLICWVMTPFKRKDNIKS